MPREIGSSAAEQQEQSPPAWGLCKHPASGRMLWDVGSGKIRFLSLSLSLPAAMNSVLG